MVTISPASRRVTNVSACARSHSLSMGGDRSTKTRRSILHSLSTHLLVSPCCPSPACGNSNGSMGFVASACRAFVLRGRSALIAAPALASHALEFPTYLLPISCTPAYPRMEHGFYPPCAPRLAWALCGTRSGYPSSSKPGILLSGRRLERRSAAERLERDSLGFSGRILLALVQRPDHTRHACRLLRFASRDSAAHRPRP